MRNISLSLFMVFFGVITSPAQWWQTNGPAGGSIYSHLSINGETLLGTSCGIYRTSDGGTTFYEHSIGMPAGNVMSMIEDDGVLIACVMSRGLYRSDDGGIHWELSRAGNYLRQDGFGQQKLLRVGDKTVARNYSSEDSLYYTSDEGLTWEALAINNSLFNNLMSAGGNLYTYSNTLGSEVGLYRSTDFGQTWQFSNEGIPADSYPAEIYEVNGILYLLSDFIYSSIDNGLTWSQNSTVALPSLSGDYNYFPEWTLLHEGRFYCQNGGNFNVQVATWMPGEPGWQIIPEIPTIGNAFTFYVIGNTPCLSRLENQFRRGINTWETFQPWNINTTQINGLFGSGVECISTSAQDDIRSIDDTESNWQLQNPMNISDEYIDLYSIVRTGENILMGVTNAFGVLDVYYSANNGSTWINSAIFDITPDSRFLANPNGAYIYGGLAGEPHVYGVDQTGAQSFDYGSPYGYTFDDKTVDLVMHDGDLYALTTNDDIQFSKILVWDLEGGTYWTIAADKIDNLFFGARCLASWQGDLYLGLGATGDWNGGVLQSADNGETWTSADSGIEGIEVNRFLTAGDSLFAATNRGVYLKTSDAASWENLSGNLPVGDIAELARTNWYLYARLANGGVWRLSLSDEVGISAWETITNQVVTYPNPCHDELFLKGLQDEQYLSVWFDSQGKIAKQEILSYNSQSLNTSDLAPGQYMLQLQKKGHQYSFIIVVE